VTVSLVLHGTPKDVANGALMEHPVTSLEIECRADSIPDDIRVEVGHLHVNEMIHVRDLVVPGGIRVLSDPENVVAVLHPPKLEEAVAEAPPAEVEQAEPELIRREEKEEEEGEEERK
jgi:large subunit ribosomal protein L25